MLLVVDVSFPLVVIVVVVMEKFVEITAVDTIGFVVVGVPTVVVVVVLNNVVEATCIVDVAFDPGAGEHIVLHESDAVHGNVGRGHEKQFESGMRINKQTLSVGNSAVNSFGTNPRIKFPAVSRIDNVEQSPRVGGRVPPIPLSRMSMRPIYGSAPISGAMNPPVQFFLSKRNSLTFPLASHTTDAVAFSIVAHRSPSLITKLGAHSAATTVFTMAN